MKARRAVPALLAVLLVLGIARMVDAIIYVVEIKDVTTSQVVADSEGPSGLSEVEVGHFWVGYDLDPFLFHQKWEFLGGKNIGSRATAIEKAQIGIRDVASDGCM